MRWGPKMVLTLAALCGAAPAVAFIPPSIAVRVVSEDRDAEAASRALVELLVAYENFLWATSEIGRSGPLACADRSLGSACLRAVLRQRPADLRAPPVLIVARSAGEGRVEWTCVGAGTGPARAADQAVTIDLAEAFAGPIARRRASQRRALACIRAAAAEAEGVIRLD